MRIYENIATQIPKIMLPKPQVDLNRWSVIACDQYTSEPEYWNKVAAHVGDAPSTYHLILPEVLLGTAEEAPWAQKAQSAMLKYLDDGLFMEHEGMILVERSVNGKTRYGLMLALDLEQYDNQPRSQSLIRTTEGAILERLPPRIKIRSGAALELPHILVLIDDPHHTVIQPLVNNRKNLPGLYDFDLMFDSGHLRGYSVADPVWETSVVSALQALAENDSFHTRYNLPPNQGALLYAMGDGNHSLDAAKAVWESNKIRVGKQHPLRFALVEVENVHDEGLVFEPIHRLLFNVRDELTLSPENLFGDLIESTPCVNVEVMVDQVNHSKNGAQTFGVISHTGSWVARVKKTTSNLSVGWLQNFLDTWMKTGQAEKIDFVHGLEVVSRLGSQKGNLGFYLPAMNKTDLFSTVIRDGALPRKAFSMGEAREKRFYLECRRID